MNSIRNVAAAGLVLLAGMSVAAPVTAAGPGKPAAPDTTPVDRFIVRFRDGAPERVDARARDEALAAAGRDSGVALQPMRRLAVGAELVRASRKLDAADAARLVQRLAANPHVQYAEADRRVQPTSLPNDALFQTKQWNLHSPGGGIHMPAAWDTATGEGIVVAVLDTGITAHPDLDANIVPGYDFISDAVLADDGDGRDANPTDKGDWVASGYCYSGSSSAESSWHGTMVAGIVAAVANNGVGVAGVAYGAKVQPIRVLGKCGGYFSDIADGIAWAAGATVAGVPDNPTPAEVINMSFAGAAACPATVQAALDMAHAQGAVVVTGTGNDAIDAANTYPANCGHVIATGATGRDGARASYSNYGAVMDVYAPGGDVPFFVQTTDNDGTQASGSPIYGGVTGTSVSAPHVAGVAALMQSLHVNTPDAVEAIIKGTARPLPGACFPGCTASLLDAERALAAVNGPFLFVHDFEVVEGDSGTKVVNITVALTQPLANAVTFNVATANGTATAGSDYVAVSATAQTIAAGATSKSYSLTINGDTLDEPDETVLVNVGNVVGATVGDAQGVITIVNNEMRKIPNYLAINGISSRRGRNLSFYFDAPEWPGRNPQMLLRSTASGTGAPGVPVVYMRYGAMPTTTTYDCKSTTALFTSCDENTGRGGRWYVWVEAVDDFSGLQILGGYQPGVTLESIGTVVEGNSGTSMLPVNVRLYEAQAYDVQVGINLMSGGNATQADGDFPSSQYVATIPAGNTTYQLGFPINGDTKVEGNETIWLTLAGTGYPGIYLVAPIYNMGNILNDDGPTASISDAIVAEDSGSATFTVSLSQPMAQDYNFYVTTSDGTATVADADYVARSSAQGTLPAGQTSAPFTVTLNPDTKVEADETFKVTLGFQYASVFDGEGVGTITNDDGPRLEVNDAWMYEGNAGTRQLAFNVSMTEPVAGPVTFDVSTVNGTATAGSDFVALNSMPMTLAAGETNKLFNVTLLGDTTKEADETFSFQLSNIVGALAQPIQGTGTIQNDDGAALTIADVNIVEGASGTSQATFTVKLAKPTNVDVTYTIATYADQFATDGVDFIGKTLVGETIPAGQTSRTFTVTINGDTTVEYNENFSVQVYDVVGADVVLDYAAICTIRNDDGPTLTIGAASVVEGNAGTRQLVFPITLSRPNTLGVVVDVSTNAPLGTATAGGDYVQRAAFVSMPAGVTSATFAVTVNGDAAVEANEMVYADILSSSNYSVLTYRGAGTILNDDGPTLSIADVTVVEGNSGTKVATFTAALSQASPSAVGYALATATSTANATDFVARPATGQSIPAGQLAKTFTVTVNGDTTVEPNETFLLNMSSATGATILDGQATGTIRNDDGPTLSIGAASVAEGNSGTKLMTFPITLSQAAAGPVTFTAATNPAIGNAVAGTDYVAVTTSGITIPAGQTATTFPVSIKGDTTVEPNEILYVDLTNAVGASIYTLRGTGTITNDD
jgi:serine protease